MQRRHEDGRGEAEGDGEGPHGLHPTLARLLGDGRGYWETILSNHQGYVSRVFQEAHWRQEVAELARRTLDTLYYNFISYLSVFVLLSVVLLRRAVRRVSALDDYLSALFLSSLSFVLAALYNTLAPDLCENSRQIQNHMSMCCVCDRFSGVSISSKMYISASLSFSYAMINPRAYLFTFSHVVFKASLLYRSSSSIFCSIFSLSFSTVGSRFFKLASRFSTLVDGSCWWVTA